MTSRDRKRVLVVEDSPEDYAVLERVAAEEDASITTDRAADATEALELLRNRSAVQPGMILLDLNLPGTDGHTLLGKLKGDPALVCIPVVVLTSSDSPRDIEKAYRLGANAYVRKPQSLPAYRSVLSTLFAFWLRDVVLPRCDGGFTP